MTPPKAAKPRRAPAPAGRERVQQKQRTRQALIDAGLRLLRSGATPTLSDIAEAAGVSPATAYRYFSSNAQLWRAVVEALGAQEPDEVLSHLPDVHARVDAMVRTFVLRRYDDEAFWRTALSAMFQRRANGQDRPFPTPTGQRMRWIEAALAPLRPELPPAEYRKLKHAFSMIVGAETMVALRDVAGLSPRAAKEATLYAARALLDSAMRSRQRPGVKRSRKR